MVGGERMVGGEKMVGGWKKVVDSAGQVEEFEVFKCCKYLRVLQDFKRIQ